MRHLTPADYTRQSWKNGKGETVELARGAVTDGALLWRLSMATVAEDGPFSLFPGIERNLTVISGPGFRLHGVGLSLICVPMMPVAFPGDVAVTAQGTENGPSEDFNVMTARHLPRAEVWLLEGAAEIPADGLLAIFALAPVDVAGRSLAPHDLILTDEALKVQSDGRALCVRLRGVALA